MVHKKKCLACIHCSRVNDDSGVCDINGKLLFGSDCCNCFEEYFILK